MLLRENVPVFDEEASWVHNPEADVDDLCVAVKVENKLIVGYIAAGLIVRLIVIGLVVIGIVFFIRAKGSTSKFSVSFPSDSSLLFSLQAVVYQSLLFFHDFFFYPHIL